MRRLLLVPLAVLLCGCPPPIFSRVQRVPPVAPPPAHGYAGPELTERSCPPVSDSLRADPWLACTPDAFNAHVASRRPDRVDVTTWGGRVARGESVLIRADTALVGRGRRPVPMADVAWITVRDRRSEARRVGAIGLTVGTTAALGAGVGALSGNDEVGTGEATVRGLASGAALGLALAVLVNQADAGERFRVEGWLDPALAPSGPGVLVSGPEGARPSGWAVGDRTACGHPMPPGARWISRCVSPDVLTQRAGAGWVEAVDVHLRDGAVLRGRQLAVTDAALTLDATGRPLADVSRIVLRAPRGRFRVIRPTLRGAATGAAYGLILGAAVAAGSGDPDALWRAPALTGALGGASGLSLGLIRGRDRARDVTWVPGP